MRIILDTDNEQNFVDLWNPEKNNWERYIKCEKKETKPLNEEDKKIEKIEMVGCNMKVKLLENETFLPTENLQTEFIIGKINEIIDYINGGTNDK